MAIDTGTKDVIIADNDCIIRNILHSLLEGDGFAVLPAVNGLVGPSPYIDHHVIDIVTIVEDRLLQVFRGG